MKKLLVITLIAGIILVIAGGVIVLADRDNWDHEFVSAGDARTGEIEVTAVNEIRVEANAARVNITTSDEDDILTYAFRYDVRGIRRRPPSIESNVRGETLTFRVDWARWNINLVFWQRVELDIILPRDFDGTLTINGNAADINVSNHSGNVDITGNAASINTADTTGRLTINGNAASIDVSRHEGDIGIRGNATNANLHFTQLAGDVNIRGNAANITLHLPSDASADVRVEGSAMTFRDEFNLTRGGGRIGDGRYSVHIEGNAATVRINQH